MEMPRPAAAHERLAAFEGTWEGDETLHPAPPWRPEATRARGRFVNRRVLDGFFLQNDYEESRDGVVNFRGHGMYGFDAKDGTYTMHWFDSMGAPPAHVPRGRFEGNVLRFEADAPFGRVAYVYETLGADEFAFRIESSPDGGTTWRPFMEGRYRRVAG